METIIVGAGTFAQVASIYFEEYSNLKVSKFAVNETSLVDNDGSGKDLITIEELLKLEPSKFNIFIAVGYREMNQVREKLFKQFINADFNLISFVHPDVKIWGNTKIGKNCFIFEDNTLQPFTQIGDNSILWSGNHVGHHSVIGENCFISSHVVISGSCDVGRNSFLGVNATIHDGISLGEFSLIGAGAIISRNTPPRSIFSPKPTQIHPKQSTDIGF